MRSRGWIARWLATVNVRQRTRLLQSDRQWADRLGHKLEESWLFDGPFAIRALERAPPSETAPAMTHRPIRRDALDPRLGPRRLRAENCRRDTVRLAVVAEARLCLAQTKRGERCRRRVRLTATRCHLHCEAQRHSSDDEVVAARVVAPKAVPGDTAVTTFARSVQVPGLQDQARKTLLRNFGGDTHRLRPLLPLGRPGPRAA
jgi:hypothetical protein